MERRWRITIEVVADAEEFHGKPPTEWDWDEMLEMGDVTVVSYRDLSVPVAGDQDEED